MATVGQIGAQVRYYLQTSEHLTEDQDILLSEFNEARRRAEQAHDFSIAQQRATCSVSASGFDLTALVLTGGHQFKSLESVYLALDAGDLPLHFKNKKGVRNDRLNEIAARPYGHEYVDQLVALENFNEGRMQRAYLHGTRLFLDPSPSETTAVAVDVCTWLPDYTSYSDSDWFTQHGATYLKWSVVVALNHRTGTFAPRQEGVLAPPERARDEALAALIRFDAYSTEQGRTPFA